MAKAKVWLWLHIAKDHTLHKETEDLSQSFMASTVSLKGLFK